MLRDLQSMELKGAAGNRVRRECPGASARGRYAL